MTLDAMPAPNAYHQPWLLIDQGNSRVKWALLGDGQPGPQHAADSPDAALAAIEPLVFDRAAIAASGDASELVRGLQAARPGLAVVEARTGSSFGMLTNAYSDPARMGVDRWLAMIGAQTLTREACCVMDVGTAVTVDLVGADGVHRGGWIVPGPELMRRSLALGTRRVGDHDGLAKVGLWGTDTPEAVVAGTRAAIRGLAFEAIRSAAPDKPRLLLTGGGAAALASRLDLAEFGAELVPDLVLRGLAAWVEERGVP
ncbi:MAG: type III pantothenate kinase [Xanthomonadales bacterium]|nr:type III pantothenate kinase [Xanthomonadales bacterium]